MYKIGVMGDRDSIYGFQSLGLTVFPIDEVNDGIRTLRAIAEEYSVIFITEKLALEMDSEIQKYNDKTNPAIIPIPGVTGNTGLGMKNVKRSVEQAVGSDILGG